MGDVSQNRITFLNREAAEVYLLLDFLSGRTDRSLRPSSEEQGRSLLQEQMHSRQARLPLRVMQAVETRAARSRKT